MAEKTTPFVVNDRRKFTSDGELRHDAETTNSEKRPQESAEAVSSRTTAETIPFPSSATSEASGTHAAPPSASESPALPEIENLGPDGGDDQLPPAPTQEQVQQAKRAYDATVDRLDTAIRASNPGADRIPAMSLQSFVQSLYMQAILQLGGGAEPGQQPQIDIIGARQTIDMLGILADKTQGNLEPAEDNLVQSALFEARMGFLEVTQAIARQAAGRGPGNLGGPSGGPSIVR